MRYTDDPPGDWDAHCIEQDKLMELLPYCDECGERIEDEFLYDFDGCLVCEECLERNHKKFTTDLMEG